MSLPSIRIVALAALGVPVACISEQSLGDPSEAASGTGSTTAAGAGPESSSGEAGASSGGVGSSPAETGSSPGETGSSSGEPEECGEGATEGMCPSACELASGEQGCEFVVLGRLATSPGETQGLWISNPSPTTGAVVDFELVPAGSTDRIAIDQVAVPAGARVQWEAPADIIPTATTTLLSSGRRLHLASDGPLEVAFDAPITDAPSSDMTVVLPVGRLEADYTVASPVREVQVLALDEPTVVQWTPSARTAGSGVPVSPVAPGDVGTVVLSPGEVLHLFVSANEEFLNGTEISADRPVLCGGCE